MLFFFSCHPNAELEGIVLVDGTYFYLGNDFSKFEFPSTDDNIDWSTKTIITYDNCKQYGIEKQWLIVWMFTIINGMWIATASQKIHRWLENLSQPNWNKHFCRLLFVLKAVSSIRSVCLDSSLYTDARWCSIKLIKWFHSSWIILYRSTSNRSTSNGNYRCTTCT